MNVTVEYASQIKRAAGIASENINVEDSCTAQELITRVAKTHGDPLQGLLLTIDGTLHPSILLFVRDQQVQWESKLQLNDGDIVTLLTPISGG